jgi:hypothetical protein
LTSFSKVFEKLLYRRLIIHINTNGKLANEKFGFCAKLSTETASYDLINEVLTAFRNESEDGYIFLDLEKAFICINHEILLTKLELYVITNKMYGLLKSYLQNCYQMLKLKIYFLLIMNQNGVWSNMGHLRDLSWVHYSSYNFLSKTHLEQQIT